MEVTADDLGDLVRAATAARQRVQASASRMTDDDCRGPSLLPGWSRGHVLTHWARNADGQSRMLLAAMRGEIAAWTSVWARWRESEIHHVDLDVGYAHGHWPADFVDLMLPQVMPTLATRLDGEITVRAEAIDRDPPLTATTASATGEPAIVRGPASAVLCWLLGRASAAAADLEVIRSGQAWPLPRLRAWA